GIGTLHRKVVQSFRTDVPAELERAFVDGAFAKVSRRIRWCPGSRGPSGFSSSSSWAWRSSVSSSDFCGPDNCPDGSDSDGAYRLADRGSVVLSRVSSERVEEGCSLERQIASSILRDGRLFGGGYPECSQRFPLRVQDAVVPGPPEGLNEIVDSDRPKDADRHARRSNADAGHPDCLADLTLTGQIQEGFHRDGSRDHRTRVPRSFRVSGRRLQMIGAEDHAGVREQRLRGVGLPPALCLPDDGLGIGDLGAHTRN